MNGEDAIVFLIVDREAKIAGYTWLIEKSTTSFYVKAQYRPMQMVKISLHGPDPKHAGKQHFRLDFEHTGPAEKAIKAGGGWAIDGAVTVPLYFPGRRINKRTLHVIRFSAEWDMYLTGIPSAPTPTKKEKATLHANVQAPPRLKVTHVDVFVSVVRPYWENETNARARDAGMGPMTNSAGMYLTAINHQRSMFSEPDPLGDVRHGVPIGQCTRGIAARLDPSGFLWVCEKMIPNAEMSGILPPAPGGAPKA